MRFLLKIFKLTAVIGLIIFTHYFTAYVLVPPWNNINIIFLVVILFVIGWESSASLWLSFLLHFFLELYSITPFGLILFPSSLSIMFAYWLYITIFTNKSWYSAVALTAVTLLFYRILYTLIFITTEFWNGNFHIFWPSLLTSYFWEIILTSLVMGIIVFIFSKKWLKFSDEKIPI